MSAKDRKNIVASVLAKLRNTSKSSGTLFQLVLQQYAMERFLYRISKSKHAQSVVLKGALLLKTIGIPNARPTMDIDMLRTGKADQATLLALVKDCATLDVAADGLHFIADSAVAEEITKDSEYKGTRILMDARMDNVRLKIQIDFGVGDVMVPGPRMIEYPVFLGGDTVKLLAYPIETAIAEKLQAMVALGNANSRMKTSTTFGSVLLILTSTGGRCSKPSTRHSRIDRRPSRQKNLRLSPQTLRERTAFSGMPSSTRWARRILPIHSIGLSRILSYSPCLRFAPSRAART